LIRRDFGIPTGDDLKKSLIADASGQDGIHSTESRQEEVKGSSNRTFGLVFAAFFSLVGLWPLLREQPLRIWALGLAGGFLIAALAWPAALGLLNRGWTRFGLLLHAIVSPIALGILFYGVITPMGVIMRLTGKDSMRLKFDRKTESYWIRREPPGPAPDSMTNQF